MGIVLLAAAAQAAEIRYPTVAYLDELKLEPVDLTVEKRTPISLSRDSRSAMAYLHVGQKVRLVGWTPEMFYVDARVATGPMRGWVSAAAVAGPTQDVVAELQRRQEAKAKNRQLIAQHEVGVGMTRDEVLESIGKPERRQRLQTAQADREVWVYVTYRYQPFYLQTMDADGKLQQTVTYRRVPAGHRAVVFGGELVVAVEENVEEKAAPLVVP